MPARVSIPLLGEAGAPARLVDVVADARRPDVAGAELSPPIAELFDTGLYQVGEAAQIAVGRFVAARTAGPFWFGPARLAPSYLRLEDPGGPRLSPEAASSAGLALAAADILARFRVPPPDHLFATGALALGLGVGRPAPSGAPATVAPVGAVGEKLSLIERHLRAAAAALDGRRVVILLPAREAGAGEAVAQDAPLVARLASIVSKAGGVIEMASLSHLDEIESVFGPLRARRRFALT